MKTAKSLVQSALKVFNLRLVRRSGFDRLVGVLDGRVAEAGWLVRDIPAWFEPVVGESAVCLALRDLIRPGDVCFDVGAFDGALTQVMARATGPRGLVCSFEANTEMLPKLTNNCAANTLSNVHLVHAAVWHTTGEWVTMMIPKNSPMAAEVNGTIDPDSPETTETAIPTLALDDFSARYGLFPNVVKMDIEGAEPHALNGFREWLARGKPHLVLEQRVEDFRAVNIVRELGYDAFDANSYEDIHTPSDFPAGSFVRNVVCIHRDRLAETAYANRQPRKLMRENLGADMDRPNSTTYEMHLRLPAGRYVAEFEASADPESTLSFEVLHDRAVRAKCCIAASWLLPNARDLAFHVHREGPATIRIVHVNGPRMRVERLKLFAVPGVTPAAGLGMVM
ncbi:MAG: FkbM family methyltransferase [Planctomycetia bacterium]|nr:FkbM family methyltransferase [Planctomycetia bacterium]